jgi:dTDP-4-dehydrorhamnose 3,5-epimerase
MHFQSPPHTDAKFVRVLQGAVHDVVLDLRPQSPAYGRWYAGELSAENGRGLFIPEGCAHGYLTLTDHAELLYVVSRPYCPDASRGVRWDTPALSGAWPFPPLLLSEQDSGWPSELPRITWPSSGIEQPSPVRSDLRSLM